MSPTDQLLINHVNAAITAKRETPKNGSGRPRKGPWLRKSDQCWYTTVGRKSVKLGKASEPKKEIERRYKLICDRLQQPAQPRRQRVRKWPVDPAKAQKMREQRSTPEGWAVQATSSAKVRAKKRGTPFCITATDVLRIIPVDGCCPILGTSLQFGGANGEATPNSPSLDRIRPELGYVPGNIAVISRRANLMKGDGTAVEHLQITLWMKSVCSN
jgi:hypothetical protein